MSTPACILRSVDDGLTVLVFILILIMSWIVWDRLSDGVIIIFLEDKSSIQTLFVSFVLDVLMDYMPWYMLDDLTC